MTRPWDAARIAEARARCEAATDGPWVYVEDEDSIKGPTESGAHIASMPTVDDFPCLDDEGPNHDAAAAEIAANNDFIAVARTALPEALDEIERLRAQVANLHADLDAMRTELIKAKRERNAALARGVK